MRDEERGDIEIAVQMDEPFAEFLADFGVHRAERFVQQQDAGLGGEGAGDGHALALAAGKLDADNDTPKTGQAEQLEQFRDALLDVRAFPFFDLQAGKRCS